MVGMENVVVSRSRKAGDKRAGACEALSVVVSVARGQVEYGTDLRVFEVEVAWRERTYVTRALVRCLRGVPVGHVTCYATRPVGSARAAKWGVALVVERAVERDALDVPRAWAGGEWREAWEHADRAKLPRDGEVERDAHGRVPDDDPTVWRRYAWERRAPRSP